MKRVLLFSTLFLISFSVQAQFQHYHFFADHNPCPFDSSISPLQYDSWDIYKTLNDEWDGTVDSVFCGVLNSPPRIALNKIGANETFFVKRKFDNINKILLTPNSLYNGSFWGNLDNVNNLNLGNNCNGTFCTSLLVGIEIPDSLGTGTAMRWHETVPTIIPSSGGLTLDFCIPTEYFTNNYLRELVFKFTIQDPNGTLFLNDLFIEEINPFLTYIIQDSINVTVNSQGEYNEIIPFASNSFIAKSNYNLYPNSYGMEYVDLNPIPNVDTAVTIDIVVEGSLTFQPFVEFQGGHLLNDTTQRHHYNIVNNGGYYCANLAERSFNGGNHYIHNAGTVDFGGKTSCMQFGEGSKLIVSDNARLDYGINGVGNLALRSRSSIEIGKGAELYINNNVMLFEYKYDTEPEQIYMTLNEGSKLSFGKMAHIGNEYSIDGLMKLNIYMKGGEVDLSQLDSESRALVNLIYDSPTAIFNDNIKVLGNPITNNIRISITNDAATDVKVSLTDVNGQTVHHEIFEVQKGYDEIQIPSSALTNGFYFITVQSNDDIFTKKIIIIK